MTELVDALFLPQHCLLQLPFAHHLGARYLLLGIEPDFDFDVQHRNGRLGRDWTRSAAALCEMDRYISELTGGACRVTSLVYSMHRPARFRLLHLGLPELASHQRSCN